MNDSDVSSAKSESFDSRQIRNYREISFYAILAGTTSLIPLPFVDDWAHRYVRRLLIRGLFQPQNLSRPQENLLVHRSQNLRTRRGCLGNALLLVVVTPLRIILYVVGRLFKKIFFVFAIKEATDRAANAFQEGFLISVSRHVCSLEQQGSFNRDQKVLQLSYAVEETMRESSSSPLRRLVRKVFRGSYGLLFRAASRFRGIRTLMRQQEPQGISEKEQEFLHQEKQELEDLVENLEAALPLEWRYLDSIAAKFQRFARSRGILARVNED